MRKTGELIKGIAYDYTEGQKNDIIKSICDTINESNNITEEQFAEIIKDAGTISNDISKDLTLFKNMDHIHAILRRDNEACMNRNLVIPREFLSYGLADELEKYDIGKDLMESYANDFIDQLEFEGVDNKPSAKDEELVKVSILASHSHNSSFHYDSDSEMLHIKMGNTSIEIYAVDVHTEGPNLIFKTTSDNLHTINKLVF